MMLDAAAAAADDAAAAAADDDDDDDDDDDGMGRVTANECISLRVYVLPCHCHVLSTVFGSFLTALPFVLYAANAQADLG